MNLTPPDASLPFRLRQSTFRVYESFIQTAIRSAPLTTHINPAPLRPSTFAARLRDAILSYSKFRWEASFSSLEFDTAWNTGDLTVSHSEQTVTIGPRKLRKSGQQAGNTIALDNPDDKRIDGIFIDRELESHFIHAFCLLLSAKLISGPLILRGQTLTATQASEFEAAYDIAITFNSANHTIII